MREISAEKVSYIIAKAREGSAAAGSDPADDSLADVKGGEGCAAARAELAGFLAAMNEEERCQLVALAWIGRGVFTREEWSSALAEARAHCRMPTAEYLLANPMLAPHLEHGLAEFVEGGQAFGLGGA
jgi:hypothetical protein